jgi:hypothetical protein
MAEEGEPPMAIVRPLRVLRVFVETLLFSQKFQVVFIFGPET